MALAAGWKLTLGKSAPQGGPGGPGGPLEVLGVAKGRQSVTLTAATTQLVDKVRFADGQAVKKGAVLIELKNTEQDAGLAQAQAQLNAAEHVYQRYQTLTQQGWASKAQL